MNGMRDKNYEYLTKDQKRFETHLRDAEVEKLAEKSHIEH